MLNGEIYNVRELRADLAINGHTFQTDLESEVLGKLYSRYGADFAKL